MKKITTLVIMLPPLALAANAHEYIFEKITTQQGLSQNDVNCIFQDHNGFLWIGTNDGLNRYDGYTFRTLRIGQGNEDGKGLPSNLIYGVKEDKKGKLWIATSNEGVCVFDVDKELFTQIRNTARIKRNDTFYLFWCLWDSAGSGDKLPALYDGHNPSTYDYRTYVYASNTPTNFNNRAPVAELLAHAPEIIQDEEDDFFISSADYPNSGINLAKLVCR